MVSDVVNMINLIKIAILLLAAGTIIGSIGFDANSAQGMSFDRSTDVLYLAAYNTYRGGQLRIADTTTGNTVLVGAFPDSGRSRLFSISSVGSIGWFSAITYHGNNCCQFHTTVDVDH